MAYSQEVIRRAQQRLESEKADKESLQRERLQQVYDTLPRVQLIDKQLRKSMVLATQALFTQEAGAAEAMEAVKQANLALQQERKKLIQDTFGPDFLDETPVCPHCNGLGYIGTRMCDCLHRLCLLEQQKELSQLHCGQGDFRDFRLEYYPDRPFAGSKISIRTIMEKTLADCHTYAVTFGQHKQNLLFSGDTGLGKTFLSACIAREVANKGYWVKYESAVHLFEKLEKAKFTGDEQAIREVEDMSRCDLLIIDDLGTEMGGTFATSALYTLMNDRILAERSTIISTNLTVDELEKKYSSQILSRLRGNYKRMAFVGDDIRILKNTGALR